MRKKILLCCLSFLLLFSGCEGLGDYREISQYDIVAGVTIDITETGQYLVTAELVQFSTGGLEGEVEAKVLQHQGKTLYQTCADLAYQLGHWLYWGHVRLVIVSERVAAEHLREVLDFFSRNKTSATPAYMMVARGDAYPVLEETEANPGELISYTLLQMMEVYRKTSQTVNTDINALITDIADPARTPILPAIAKIQNGSEWVPTISGSAFFGSDDLRGFIDRTQSMIVCVLRGQAEQAIYELAAEDVICALKLENFHVEIENFLDQEPRMEINIRMKGTIASAADLSDELTRDRTIQIAHAASSALKKEFTACVQQLQRAGSGDVLDLGSAFAGKFPDYWNTHRDEWPEVFARLPISVEVQVEIDAGRLEG